jgi:hypothetical protein
MFEAVVETDGLTNSDSLYLSKVMTFVLQKESNKVLLLPCYWDSWTAFPHSVLGYV